MAKTILKTEGLTKHYGGIHALVDADFEIKEGEHIAIVGEFTYSLAFYMLGGVKHPYFTGVAPLSAIEGQASAAGSRLAGGLPHFWTLALNLRFRF